MGDLYKRRQHHATLKKKDKSLWAYYRSFIYSFYFHLYFCFSIPDFLTPFKLGWNMLCDFERHDPIECRQPKGFDRQVEMRDSSLRVLWGEGRSVISGVRGQSPGLVQQTLVFPGTFAKTPHVLPWKWNRWNMDQVLYMALTLSAILVAWTPCAILFL